MKFQLDQGQFNKFRKELIVKVLPLFLIPLIAVMVFTGSSGQSSIMLIPIFLFVIAVVIYNTIKKQKKAWETFELIVNEDSIERIQEGFPTINVSKKDILNAIVASNGAITLVTQPKSSSIIIPFSVNNKTELLEAISTFTTIQESNQVNGLWLTYGSGVLGVALFFTFMLSTNFYLTIIAGLILLVVGIYAFIEIQRNKNIDKKVKRSSYVMFIFLLVIVAKIYITFVH